MPVKRPNALIVNALEIMNAWFEVILSVKSIAHDYWIGHSSTAGAPCAGASEEMARPSIGWGAILESRVFDLSDCQHGFGRRISLFAAPVVVHRGIQPHGFAVDAHLTSMVVEREGPGDAFRRRTGAVTLRAPAQRFVCHRSTPPTLNSHQLRKGTKSSPRGERRSPRLAYHKSSPVAGS